MAFVGTLLAAIVSFPLAFVAARNITRSKLANQVTKRFFDFQRSVDMLIWALFFTRGFGPGPLAGMSAIFFTDTGTLGKLYSEALENIDNKPREGVVSVGAPPVAVQRFGVLPQVLPLFASQALYFWESNTRSHQFRLGKRGLYGAAHPCRGLHLRRDIEYAALAADGLRITIVSQNPSRRRAQRGRPGFVGAERFSCVTRSTTHRRRTIR
jgi:hypothetical protein